MLYLFNSAGDKGYVTNVLNTLYLPIGNENVYQYSVNLSGGKNDNNYVQPRLAKEYFDNKKPLKDHKDVLIIFVDKEKTPYQYIPLRKALLKNVKYSDDRLYFYVELQDYCHSSSLKEFNSNLSKKYSDLLFKKPGNTAVTDTEEVKNHLGYLAFDGDTDIISRIKSNNESWIKTVHILAKLSVFTENKSVFSKIEFENFTRNGKSKRLNNNSNLTLWKGYIYKANISYHNPYGNRNALLKMVIAPEKALSRIENLQTKLQLSTGITHFSFQPQKACKAGMLCFGIENDNQDISFADKEIRFKVHRSVGTWICIIVLLIIAAFSLYTTSDIGSVDNILSLLGISVSNNTKTIISIFSSLLSVVALWGAANLFSGSK